jgi:hypothetical protein
MGKLGPEAKNCSAIFFTLLFAPPRQMCADDVAGQDGLIPTFHYGIITWSSFASLNDKYKNQFFGSRLTLNFASGTMR